MTLVVWIPLLVAICASVMAFVFGTLIERIKRRNSLQTEAYAEYLLALTRSASPTIADRQKAQSDAAYAKCKIVVHGSSEVIHTLKQFEQAGAATATAEGRDRLIDIVVAMRGNKKVSRGDIACLLLGVPSPKSLN
jgi:hypothetical protein